MPEGDRFERQIQPAWRRAYRLAVGNTGSNDQICDDLAKSLCETLRRAHGVPGFQEIVRCTERATSGLWPPPPTASDVAEIILRSIASLDVLVRNHPDDRHTRIAAEIAKAFLADQLTSGGRPQRADSATTIATQTCAKLVRHYFFSRVDKRLVTQGRFASHAEAEQWQREIEVTMRPALLEIAHRLAADPDASALRAPKRTVARKSTFELLNENLLAPSEARTTSARS